VCNRTASITASTARANAVRKQDGRDHVGEDVLNCVDWGNDGHHCIACNDDLADF